MAILDILCSSLLNVKTKIMKVEHRKIFCGPSKILRKKIVTHEYVPKILHGPHKTSPAPFPTYLMYGQLLLNPATALETCFFGKGGPLFSACKSRDCKIRSLSMRSISYCTRPHVFTSFARLKEKFNWLELFFSGWRMMTSK